MVATGVVQVRSACNGQQVASSCQHDGRVQPGVLVCMCVCVFITAGPITKLFAGGEEESGGHVL
jgi:hypothetical protein